MPVRAVSSPGGTSAEQPGRARSDLNVGDRGGRSRCFGARTHAARIGRGRGGGQRGSGRRGRRQRLCAAAGERDCGVVAFCFQYRVLAHHHRGPLGRRADERDRDSVPVGPPRILAGLPQARAGGLCLHAQVFHPCPSPRPQPLQRAPAQGPGALQFAGGHDDAGGHCPARGDSHFCCFYTAGCLGGV